MVVSSCSSGTASRPCATRYGLHSQLVGAVPRRAARTSTGEADYCRGCGTGGAGGGGGRTPGAGVVNCPGVVPGVMPGVGRIPGFAGDSDCVPDSSCSGITGCAVGGTNTGGCRCC